jgi:hypothetical protein
MIGCIGGGPYEIPNESGFYTVALCNDVIVRARGDNGFVYGCQTCTDRAQFVSDVTVPDGTV